jgi:hypothetical protein
VLPLEDQLVENVCEKKWGVSCKSPTKHLNTLFVKCAEILALNLAVHIINNEA